MSLLDGPLNMFAQRATGETVRTQNGELYPIFPRVSSVPLKRKLCS